MLSFQKARRIPGTTELEATFNFKVTGTHHGFTMAKTLLTSLIFFCDEVSCSVDEAIEADTICLDFNKALPGILVAKLVTYSLDR